MKRRFFTLAMAGLLLLAACGDDAGDGTAGTDAAADGVSTASTDLGTVLVDPDGMTMYVFLNDTDGESTCYDSCAGNWPAVPGDAAISSDLDSAMFGTTTRTDGTEQLTVGGQPLYTYAPDANPGDTTGQGVGDVWFVVGADGAMIGGPEAAATTGSGIYGD
jgi:predicted lipoprotein with Yx(FWY)xxD motif